MTERDLKVLDEGEPIYASLEHQALYAAWKMHSTSAEKIRQRFVQPGPQTKFTTIALPYIYPLFSLKRERKEQPEDHGSRLRSGQRSLLWRLGQLMRIQRVTRVGGVKGRYVPGVGGDPALGLPRRLTPRWSLPPPARHVSRKYLTRIFHASALDTNRISSPSATDSYRSRNRCTQDRNLIHRRIP